MSLAELMVVLLVALVVFGPNKLPMLARHLGLGLRFIQRMQQYWQGVTQTQIAELILMENEKKAKQVDEHYQSDREVLRHEKNQEQHQ